MDDVADGTCCGACPMHGLCRCEFNAHGRCTGEHPAPAPLPAPFSMSGLNLLPICCKGPTQ